MASGSTEIVNRALRLLKAQRITSLTDGSTNANTAKDIFDEVLEDCLRQHTWHFATKLAKLARRSTAPTFGFDYAYALPADWIRTVSVHDNDAGLGNVDYEEAEVASGGSILTSVENCYLRYVYRVTDINRLSADFRTAMAYALAVQMPGINNLSTTGWDRLEKQAAKKMIAAKSRDSLGTPNRQRPIGTWVAGRMSWPSTRWPR